MSGAREHLLAVQAALAAGKLAEAEQAARAAVAQAPQVSECRNALGVVLRAQGRIVEAIAAYEDACALDPRNARALNNRGEALHALHRSAEAEPFLLAALKIDADFVDAWRNLAAVLIALQRQAEARQALDRLSLLLPNDERITLQRAGLAQDEGDLARAVALYEQALKQNPQSMPALNNLGALCLERGEALRALHLFEHAQTLAPDDLAAEYGVRESLARLVPPWHVGMMNEIARTEAYRAAIEASVSPQDHVLEIGTGAGLLALLAARAGAAHVTTCEMVKPVAEAARVIVGANGYADRVTVVGKKSTDLQIGVDLPVKADLLASEILADDFIGEGVVASFLDARRRLLKPDARVVPQCGAIRILLVGGPEIESLLHVGRIEGFDFSRFRRFTPWRQEVARSVEYEALSAEQDALVYDFTTMTSPPPETTRCAVPVLRAGTCVAVLQWLRIQLAPGIAYENHPARVRSVWNPVLYALPTPRFVRPGDIVDVVLRQYGNYLYVTAR